MANPILSEGSKAPDFELPSVTPDAEGPLRLSSLAGQRVVLYFYPKDDTPGCTAQACDFRDNLARISALGYTVLGISPDGTASHLKFRDKYGLTFPLLSDADHAVSRAWGVWRLRSKYGRESEGMVRSTFLVGEDGTLLRIWDNVRAKGHVERLLRELEALT